MTLRGLSPDEQTRDGLHTLTPGALRLGGNVACDATLKRAERSRLVGHNSLLSLAPVSVSTAPAAGDVAIRLPLALAPFAESNNPAPALPTSPVPTPQAPKSKVEPITRDLTKTISFLILHLLVGFTVAYLFTGSLAIASGIALVEPLVNAVVFFFHERAWRRTDVPLLDILTHRHSRKEA